MQPPKTYREDLSKILELNDKAQEMKFHVWKEHVVYTVHWWVGVCLAVIPWILWLLIRKKESANRMLFAGFFIIIFSVFFDFLGTKLGFWFYYYDVIPFIPAFSPWDLTLIPVLAITLIEIKPEIHPVVKAIFFSGFTAFLAEPFFEYLGLYHRVKWNSFYSFPIFFCMYLAGHYLTTRKSFARIRN